MPLFKFMNGKKDKKVPKKASSMNNIYNDYSGVYQDNEKVDEVIDRQPYRGMFKKL